MHHLNKKAPKYFTKPVNFDPDGSRTMLISNKQCSLRVLDRNQGEDLVAYYQRCNTKGDIREHHNLVRVTTGEQLDGNLLLLGELPTAYDLQFPVYINRDERVAIETSSLGYRAALNIKYT